MTSLTAKSRIEREIITVPVRQSASVQNLAQKVRDTSRQLDALEREIAKKQSEIDRMRALGREKFVSRENDIINLSMMIIQLTDRGDGGVNAEEIFMDSDDPVIVRRRRNMNEMISSVRFLYAFDNMGDLNEEMRHVVAEATQDWNAFIDRPQPGQQ